MKIKLIPVLAIASLLIAACSNAAEKTSEKNQDKV